MHSSALPAQRSGCLVVTVRSDHGGETDATAFPGADALTELSRVLEGSGRSFRDVLLLTAVIGPGVSEDAFRAEVAGRFSRSRADIRLIVGADTANPGAAVVLTAVAHARGGWWHVPEGVVPLWTL